MPDKKPVDQRRFGFQLWARKSLKARLLVTRSDCVSFSFAVLLEDCSLALETVV
jgi:hypothetical protein